MAFGFVVGRFFYPACAGFRSALLCLYWFWCCFSFSVHLIFVSDSPSSVVNKQLGSMTLDEEQGASFPLFPSLFLIFFHSFAPELCASVIGAVFVLSHLKKTLQICLSVNRKLQKDTEAFCGALSVNGHTLTSIILTTFSPLLWAQVHINLIFQITSCTQGHVIIFLFLTLYLLSSPSMRLMWAYNIRIYLKGVISRINIYF